MSRIVVRTVAESRRAPAALLQIRCPNGGRGFITRVAALRCRCVAASVRPPAVVPLAPQRAGARSSCSASGRRTVPHPRSPAGGLSAPCRRPCRFLLVLPAVFPHRVGGPFRILAALSGDRSPHRVRAATHCGRPFPRGGGPAM